MKPDIVNAYQEQSENCLSKKEALPQPVLLPPKGDTTKYKLYKSQHELAKRDFLYHHPLLLPLMIVMFQTEPPMNSVEELCCTSVPSTPKENEANYVILFLEKLYFSNYFNNKKESNKV